MASRFCPWTDKIYHEVAQPFESDYIYETLHCTTTNLQDHLHWQLGLNPMSDVDRAIATAVIDAVNDDGFLTQSLAELHSSLNSPNFPIEQEEILAVIHRIQRFDPIGCGASNLIETLTIQLKSLSAATPCLHLAQKLISENIELLAHHGYRQLMKMYKVDESTLEHALHLIQHLNPKPGSVLSQKKTEYVMPDLTVKKINRRWQVSLNQNVLPQLGINNHYASLVKQVHTPSDLLTF